MIVLDLTEVMVMETTLKEGMIVSTVINLQKQKPDDIEGKDQITVLLVYQIFSIILKELILNMQRKEKNFIKLWKHFWAELQMLTYYVVLQWIYINYSQK